MAAARRPVSPGRMTRAPLAAAVALALASLTACSSPAEGYVEDAADAIELRLGRMRRNDPLAMAHAAASRRVDVLAYGATGQQSATVEVRITREEEPAGWSSGSRATRCYRFEWARFEVTRRRIDCDDRPALVLPELPPPPTLPGGIDEAVLAALSDLAVRGLTDEAAVRDAVTPLAGGPPVAVDVATVGTDVGVSVHVPGQCLFGRISGGAASVWRVPRVLAQPGELGCAAGHAAQGDGTRPPH